jgi:hypothetical protein
LKPALFQIGQIGFLPNRQPFAALTAYCKTGSKATSGRRQKPGTGAFCILKPPYFELMCGACVLLNQHLLFWIQAFGFKLINLNFMGLTGFLAKIRLLNRFYRRVGRTSHQKRRKALAGIVSSMLLPFQIYRF